MKSDNSLRKWSKKNLIKRNWNLNGIFHGAEKANTVDIFGSVFPPLLACQRSVQKKSIIFFILLKSIFAMRFILVNHLPHRGIGAKSSRRCMLQIYYSIWIGFCSALTNFAFVCFFFHLVKNFQFVGTSEHQNGIPKWQSGRIRRRMDSCADSWRRGIRRVSTVLCYMTTMMMMQ